jgi:hypothetical protein
MTEQEIRLLYVLQDKLKLTNCEIEWVINHLEQPIHNFVKVSSCFGLKNEWHCSRCNIKRKSNPYVTTDHSTK